MKKVFGDSFDEVSKYKLYRNVYEIIHPTISKKNISSYRIVFHDELVPVRIFYPEKVSNLTSIIIFIHGDSTVTGCNAQYSQICMDMAKELDRLVIALDYEEFAAKKFPALYEVCYRALEYLYQEFHNLGLSTKKIALVGDSTGATIALAMGKMAEEKKTIHIEKQVLFYPALSGEYFGKTQFSSIEKNSEMDLLTIPHLKLYYQKIMGSKRNLTNSFLVPFMETEYKKIPTTMILTGNMDPLHDESYEYYQRLFKDNSKSKYLEFEFVGHGFLKSPDREFKKELFEQILEFLK